MLSLPRQLTGSAKRHPVRRTLQHIGQSVSHIPPSPDGTGNRTCRPAHSSPLRGYAGPGTATDRLHHFLQWSQVRCFRSHFQAGNKGFMPIEQDWRRQVAGKVADYGQATLWWLNDAPRTTLVIESADRKTAIKLFDTVYHSLDIQPGEDEPMMNVLVMYEDNKWIVFVFPRAKHRPACYTAEGDANLLSSPASVDLGGVFITPVEKDFIKITAEDIAQILGEVCLSPADFQKVRKRIQEQL